MAFIGVYSTAPTYKTLDLSGGSLAPAPVSSPLPVLRTGGTATRTLAPSPLAPMPPQVSPCSGGGSAPVNADGSAGGTFGVASANLIPVRDATPQTASGELHAPEIVSDAGARERFLAWWRSLGPDMQALLGVSVGVLGLLIMLGKRGS